jgi:hypothetical protein
MRSGGAATTASAKPTTRNGIRATAVNAIRGSASGKSAMVRIPPPTSQPDTSSATSTGVVVVVGGLADMGSAPFSVANFKDEMAHVGSAGACVPTSGRSITSSHRLAFVGLLL